MVKGTAPSEASMPPVCDRWWAVPFDTASLDINMPLKTCVGAVLYDDIYH